MVGLAKLRFTVSCRAAWKRVAIARVLANDCEVLLWTSLGALGAALTRESFSLLEIWAHAADHVIL
jgi:ABC-type taurine transport system ATPase subunit